jgi:hypothetical protein
LLGTGEHTFDFYYHFAPGVKLYVVPSLDSIQVSLRAGEYRSTLSFHTLVPANADVLEGWVSPRYGRREPASVLRLRVAATPPLLVSMLVMPFQKGGRPCAESAGS